MSTELKSVRICAENSAAIDAAVAAVTGNHTAPVYASFDDIHRHAVAAEKALERLDLTLQCRVGATLVAESRKPGPKNNGCTCLLVTLRRRTAAWYLERVQQRVADHPENAGCARLTLTPDQDNRTIEQLTRKYDVRFASAPASTAPSAPAMEAIRICPAKQPAIRAALQTVNGRATAHTLTTFREIEDLAKDAERALQQLQLAPRDRVGAVYTHVSGAPVAKGYTYKRPATRVTLHRRTGSWYIANIEAAEVWAQGGGRPRLTLTSQQHAHAVELRRKHYVVRRPDQLAAETTRTEALAVLHEILSSGDAPASGVAGAS